MHQDFQDNHNKEDSLLIKCQGRDAAQTTALAYHSSDLEEGRSRRIRSSGPFLAIL